MDPAPTRPGGPLRAGLAASRTLDRIAPDAATYRVLTQCQADRELHVHTERFPFSSRAPWSRLLPAAFHEAPQAVVECNDVGLSASFGPFDVTTPWRNVRDVSVSGPYRWFRVIGPRLSLADRGVTFGTSTEAGVCIRFHEPVAALFGSRRVHPGLTVTVADPHGLAAAIEARLGADDR